MRSFLLFTGLVLALTVSAQARRIERVTETVEPRKATRIDIECDLGAGTFNINTADMKEVAVVDIAYNRRTVDYVVDYEERGDKGYLTLESDHKRDFEIDTEDNRWDITLSTEFETVMNMDIGACDADVDLGGLPLTGLSIDVGAASGRIDFSKPNPKRLDRIEIDAGASSLNITSIGNANFDLFDFSGGVGSFELDFRGEYKRESEINIEIGLGSADIVLPRGVAVRVETEGSGWLSSVDFHNDDLIEVDDDLYESEDFDSATDRIIIRLEVGLGSLDIYWKR